MRGVILVVDDERANRRLLSEMVRVMGHEPLVASDGAEALEILAQAHVDLVLLDLMMPGVDGLTVLERLTAMGRVPGLPVLVVSAMTEREARLAALERGASDFVTKPVDRLEVTTRVRNLVALKRLRDRLENRGDRLQAVVKRQSLDWQALVASVPALILALDRVGRVTSSNGRAEAFSDAPLGARLDQLVRTEDEGAVQEALTAVLSGSAPSRQLIVYPRTATRRALELVISPVREGGVVVGGVAVAQDVTARIDAEAETQSRLQFVRQTLDTLSAQVAILDGEGRVIASNEAWRAVPARGETTLVRAVDGAGFLACCDAVRETMGGALGDGVRSVLSGARDRVELEISEQEAGEQMWLVCRISTFAGSGPGRVVVALTDISSTKRAELTLRERERRHRLLLDNLPGVAFQCGRDRDRAMRLVSAGVRSLLGIEPEDLTTGRVAFTGLIHPDDRARVTGHWESGLSEAGTFELEYRMCRADGTWCWVWEQARAVRDEACRLIGVEGFLSDISDRKLTEAALRQAQKLEAVGQLTSGIAHDFNNIMSVIIAFTGFVLDDFEEGDPRREDLLEVQRAAERAVDLTRQLLIFSRTHPSARRAVDLNANIDKTLRMLQRMVGTNIKVTFESDLRPAVIQIDPIQLDQLVMNMAVNARDAMPDGGELRIVLSPRPAEGEPSMAPSMLSLCFADTGVGMDESTRARIFEPFFTTKAAGRGTGLGLATCMSIVRDSGGSIQVESWPGRGTCFSVLFPLSGKAAELNAELADRHGHGNGEHVLLAEDDHALRAAAARTLESAGYRVTAVCDGHAACGYFELDGEPVEVLVTDLIMPGRSGYEVIDAARERCPGLPVVLTTGYIDDRLREGVEGQYPDPLAKPYALGSLLRAVERALGIAPEPSAAGREGATPLPDAETAAIVLDLEQ